MSPISVNFSDVEDFELLPAGVYPATVTAVTESENPGPSGYTYLNWEFTILEGEFEDRKQWTITSLSPKAAFRLKEVLVAFGVSAAEIAEMEEFEPSDYLGTHVHLSVTQENYEGTLRNTVKSLHAVEGASAKGTSAKKGPKIR
jgi:hypothetical protein